ncbi:MAG: hypothetical protein AAGA77_07320 [Bacteroidota bacterium]
MIRNIFFVLIVLSSIETIGFGQYRSLDVSLYGSNYLDRIKDMEYDYEIIRDGNLFQFALGHSNGLKKHLSLEKSLGISIAEGIYENYQTMVGSGSNEERTFILKNKRLIFLKIGLGATYWFHFPGKGPYINSEFLCNFPIAAKSEEMKKIDDDPTEVYEVDFKQELKDFVPSFKLGLGYNLLISSQVFVNAGLYMDVRTGSYFKVSEGFNFLNRGVELGLGYIFTQEVN